jgi:hypothetical protein
VSAPEGAPEVVRIPRAPRVPADLLALVQ